MKARLALAGAACACAAAWAQHAPAPEFVAPNLTPSGVRALAANCAPCHGTEGVAAPGSEVAGLAGRTREEIAVRMRAFKEGRAPATVMQQIAKGYSDEEIDALADYFARRGR